MALSIRPLTAQDLSEAGRIIRLAFGAFLGAPEPEQAVCLRACRAVTESVYPGLDVEREIRAVHAQALGDAVLLWEDQDVRDLSRQIEINGGLIERIIVAEDGRAVDGDDRV